MSETKKFGEYFDTDDFCFDDLTIHAGMDDMSHYVFAKMVACGVKSVAFETNSLINSLLHDDEAECEAKVLVIKHKKETYNIFVYDKIAYFSCAGYKAADLRNYINYVYCMFSKALIKYYSKKAKK